MKATVWNNGQPSETGAGYGLAISEEDRDAHFRREWSSVTLRIEGDEIAVRLTPSFWRSCTELRSKAIGQHMLQRGLAPWPRGRPPELELVPEGEREFRLECPSR